MSKEKRQIEKKDLMPANVYTESRKQIRKDLVEFKKNRRIALGPYATFYFESFETMVAQIQEMLHIEKGGDEQIADELEAYNPLIPKGNELIATMMIEIDDPGRRDKVLRQLGGVENTITIAIGDDVIQAVTENDVERTKSDGKTSSIHFLHFPLSAEQIDSFKTTSTKTVLGFGHEHYAHMAVIPDAARSSLIGDLD